MLNITKKGGEKIVVAKMDLKSYGELLARTTPKIIETKKEYEHYLALIEELLEKGKKKSREEKQLLNLLVMLVEQYEQSNFQLNAATPVELLKHLMEARDLKQKDLVHLFNSRGYASDIINGKRPITVEIAKKLGQFFNVEPGIFVY